MLLFALPELGLDRRRHAGEIVEAAEVGAVNARRLELPPEERDRERPRAIELTREPFGLEPPERLDGHRLDRGVVVAVVGHRFTIASAKRGGPAASGISVSGTS